MKLLLPLAFAIALPRASRAADMMMGAGFNTTAGCEDRCAAVEDPGPNTACNASEFDGCECVFADQYCVSMCDAGEGAWMMICAGAGGGGGGMPAPDIGGGEERPPAPTFNTTAGCEEKCGGVEDTDPNTACNATEFEGCTCVWGDKGCESSCVAESGEWETVCAGGDSGGGGANATDDHGSSHDGGGANATDDHGSSHDAGGANATDDHGSSHDGHYDAPATNKTGDGDEDDSAGPRPGRAAAVSSLLAAAAAAAYHCF